MEIIIVVAILIGIPLGFLLEALFLHLTARIFKSEGATYKMAMDSKKSEKIKEGDILITIFDNPSSGETIVQMCDQAGHEILEKKEESGRLIYKIEKG